MPNRVDVAFDLANENVPNSDPADPFAQIVEEIQWHDEFWYAMGE